MANKLELTWCRKDEPIAERRSMGFGFLVYHIGNVMKIKLRVTILLLLILITSLGGCAQWKTDSKQYTAKQQSTTEQQNENKYQTEEFGFVIPESWEGKFTIKDFEQGISFYSKAIYDINSTGNLFNIVGTSEVGEWESYPDYKFLGSADDKYFFITFPTDVQFDVDNNELSDEYLKMQEDINSIVDSFELYGKSVSYEDPNREGGNNIKSQVDVILDYIGVEIDKIAEDAKYTGGLVLTYPKETVLPYLKCYEPSGNEIYCIFVPKESTGRNNKYFAVVDGKIVAAGFLLEESTANVYQLIRQSNFVDYEPNIVDIGTGGELKDLIWNAQNGTLNIRTTKAGSGDDYKGWLVINYCYISY